MRGEKKATPLFRLTRRITIATTVLVFLAYLVCAQDLRQRQQECEKLFSVAVAAEQRNDPIEAELRYQECRELAQKYRLPKMEAAALHRLAVIKARNKRFSESANLFRRAIELDPQNALILCDFAQLYADRKDFSEAEIILKNALNVDPNNPKVLYGLGIVIATQRGERFAEGLRYLKLAVGEAKAYRELARIYRSNGDISRAEFAEQRAKLAEGQRDTTGGLASRGVASDNTAVSDRPPQREPHQPQTPPEVVNRVRQELVEVEMREIAETLRNFAISPTTPPVAQSPFIPALVSPTTSSGVVAASPRETFPVVSPGPVTQTVVVSAPQPATGQPVDPFAMVAQQQKMVTQQQKSPNSPVRRLDSPPVAVTSPQSAVRTISNQTEPGLRAPSPNIQPSNSIKTDVVVSHQTAGNSTTNTEPPLVRIASSFPSDQRLPQRVSASVRPTRQDNFSPVRGWSGGSERGERAETVNPLRQIPADRTNLLDPGTDTSLIATLPSYSAVGTTKIPRTDQGDLQGPSGGVPNAAERQLGRIVALRTIEVTEKTEGPRETIRHLPARDVDVLQSPSAVIARREIPESVPKSTPPLVAEVRSEPSPVRAMPRTAPERDSTRIAQSDRRFSAATAPDVFSFAPASKEPPPEIHTFEPIVAARPLETSTLPLIVAVPIPDTVFADPFPVLNDQSKLAEVKREESPVSPIIEPATPPFAVANNPPRVAETRPTPAALPTREEPATPPFAIANNPPRVAETRPVPATLPTREEPAAPPFAVANNPPRVAETRPTPAALPTREEPTTPFAVASNPPRVAETRPTPAALPTREEPAPPFVIANNPPRVAETRPAPAALPTREEPAPPPFAIASNPPRVAETRPAPAALPTREEPTPPFAVASNPPRVAETRPTPAALPTREEPAPPFAIASNPPRVAETRPTPAALPTREEPAAPPFAVASNPPRVAEARPTPAALPTREEPAVPPFAVASNPPRVAETRPAPAASLPTREEPTAPPFAVASNPPRVAETRPAPAALPTPARGEPAAPSFAVASNPPRVAEARSVPNPLSTPTMEIAARPLPALEEFFESFPVVNNVPKIADVRTVPTAPLSVPARDVAARPQPAREEPTGFASSRRTGQTSQDVKVSENDDTTGFARSRR